MADMEIMPSGSTGTGYKFLMVPQYACSTPTPNFNWKATLGTGHTLWWTYYSSYSSVMSATLMTKMLRGRWYRSCQDTAYISQVPIPCRIHCLVSAQEPYLSTNLRNMLALPCPHLKLWTLWWKPWTERHKETMTIFCFALNMSEEWNNEYSS